MVQVGGASSSSSSNKSIFFVKLRDLVRLLIVVGFVAFVSIDYLRRRPTPITITRDSPLLVVKNDNNQQQEQQQQEPQQQEQEDVKPPNDKITTISRNDQEVADVVQDDNNDLFATIPYLKHSTTNDGKNWQVWDRQSELSYDGTTCIWVNFRARHVLDSSPEDVKMCAYPSEQDNWVSNGIIQSGRWGDCDSLPSIWNNEVVVPTAQSDPSNKIPIYLEIGANIGSCLMEMLMSTTARIIAFEPDPRNIAQLTKTLMNLPLSYRNRVLLYPIALGSTTSTSTVHQATNNRGNTVIGKEIKDFEGQTFLPTLQVHIESLDNLLMTNAESITKDNWYVGLLKLDAQGYECEIIRGATKILQRTNILKTEFDDLFLKGHNCSSPIFEELVINANPNLYISSRENMADVIFRIKKD